ncbi:unnamed protein product [Amoebophrya sp. A120]|nr:unnamed protein product [Amoebophrya sp. A120]|eukprot:GSA120T00010466001.1
MDDYGDSYYQKDSYGKNKGKKGKGKGKKGKSGKDSWQRSSPHDDEDSYGRDQQDQYYPPRRLESPPRTNKGGNRYDDEDREAKGRGGYDRPSNDYDEGYGGGYSASSSKKGSSSYGGKASSKSRGKYDDVDRDDYNNVKGGGPSSRQKDGYDDYNSYENSSRSYGKSPSRGKDKDGYGGGSYNKGGSTGSSGKNYREDYGTQDHADNIENSRGYDRRGGDRDRDDDYYNDRKGAGKTSGGKSSGYYDKDADTPGTSSSYNQQRPAIHQRRRPESPPGGGYKGSKGKGKDIGKDGGKPGDDYYYDEREAAPQQIADSRRAPAPEPARPVVVKTEEEVKATLKKIKGILNKLSPQKFDSLADQLKEVITCPDDVEMFAEQIFDKVVKQHNFLELYTDMCVRLNSWCQEGTIASVDPKSFRSILLNRCQSSFEKYLHEPEPNLEATEMHSQLEVETLYKKCMLGTVKFVGKLIVNELLASRLILMICDSLLESPGDTIKVENLTVFLKVIGPEFDKDTWAHHKELKTKFFQLMDIANTTENKKVRFAIMNLLDTRKNNWVEITA